MNLVDLPEKYFTHYKLIYKEHWYLLSHTAVSVALNSYIAN